MLLPALLEYIIVFDVVPHLLETDSPCFCLLHHLQNQIEELVESQRETAGKVPRVSELRTDKLPHKLLVVSFSSGGFHIRMIPHNQLVEHHTKGIYIALRVSYVIPDRELFRSDIGQGSLSTIPKFVALIKDAQSEVSQLINVLPD